MAQAPTVALPTRLPLVITPDNRDDTTAKDAKLVNAYCEQTTKEETHIYKRPGLLQYGSTLSGNGYGVYNWLGDIYSVFGSSFKKNGLAVGTVDATGGVYRFTPCLGTSPKLTLGNGVKAYNYDPGGGLVQITDVDFPSSFVKGWSYLDGTTYVMNSGASIFGSGLNDPPTWDPLNVIIAQIEPDGGIALAKQLVYTIALKQWSTEVFYDAGNATGSPLGRVEGAKLAWGCASADSVRSIDGILLWAATNRDASIQVVMVDNLKPKVVSTKPVERLLDQADFSTGNVFSWTTNIDGHRFYVLTLKANNLTLAYDMKEDKWHQWTDKNGNYFPIVDSTYLGLTRILQHETNGKLYTLDSSYYNDDGDYITVDIYTPNFDGGVRRKKQMNMLQFIADQTPGSILQVRKNDDDYAPTKWSNFRTVDLSMKRPFLMNCGSFHRRVHHFRHRCNTPFRIQAVEMQLDIGTL